MPCSTRIWLLAVLATAIFGSCPHSQLYAQLTAEQVVVVAAAKNPDSRAVAEAYCEFRKFSVDRILEVEFPTGVTLARSLWEDEIRGQIAARMRALDPEEKITNVVVAYGTPLAVAAWEDDRELKQWEAYYQKSMDDGIRRLNTALKVLGQLGGQEPASVQLPINLVDLRAIFQQQIELAQKGNSGKPAEEQPVANAQLQNQVQAVAGLFPFMNSLQQQVQAGEGEALANMQQQLQYLRGRSEALTQTIQYLEKMPASFERDATMIALLEQGGGLLDVLTWLQRQMDLVQMNDSMASLDSELALIFWGEYRRIGAVPNFLNPAFEGSPLRNAYRTLRVSRIDGPTAEVAKQLIERTRAAEALTELQGKAYLDLRGIQSSDPLLQQTENWLRAVGEQLKSVSGIQVEVESSAKLFQSGQCPDTLIYLGWYSLGKYIDCCTFKPGAVAYHLVPGDALRLRDAEQQGWCRSFLEAGATRVVGSVGEAMPVLLTVDPTAKQSPMAINITTAELSDGMIIFAVP
jgi:uncharacterized protein (TIGR03790 family)